MKRVLSFLLVFTLHCAGAQSFTVETVVFLDGTMGETSGLIHLEDRFITHNDSGSEPLLYELDTLTGLITRSVTVANAGCVDWEDICYDSDYIYVGDFGNNAGTRTDLAIYKIAISDYLEATNDTVYADTIRFSYADQTDFEPALYSTNYDAEALITCNDSLYLFTKNWGNAETNVYSIPKNPGTYSVSIIDNFNPEGLITGADYDPEKNEILLSGYTLFSPFVFFIKGFTGNQFSEGNLKRATPTFEGSSQIESSASIGNHTFLISSEDDGSASTLHRVHVSDFIGIEENKTEQVFIYPNPVNNELFIQNLSEKQQILISDLSGKILLTSYSSKIDISSLESGCYLLMIKDKNQNLIASEKITKR